MSQHTLLLLLMLHLLFVGTMFCRGQIFSAYSYNKNNIT